jgi:hypothetical protein
MAREVWHMTPLSRLFPELKWNRDDQLWRIAVGGELILGEDGQPVCWLTFNEAYDVMVKLERAAWPQKEAAVMTDECRPPVAEIGACVVDTRTERTAVVTDVRDGRLYLRPPGWGEEWEAMPAHVRLATEPERLSARLAEDNLRSRMRGVL